MKLLKNRIQDEPNKMEKDLQNEEALKKLKKLAEDVRICMFANTDPDSNDYGRPMATIEVEDDGTIWFFTKSEKGVALKAKNGNEVCLYYSHPGKNTYLTVQGTSEIIKDRKKMEDLYTPVLKAWFPKGLDEPDIALLKVTPEEAHYWDTDAAKLVVLFSMVKAAVTGQVSDTGDHGTLKIQK
jgi:general stress protein 26